MLPPTIVLSRRQHNARHSLGKEKVIVSLAGQHKPSVGAHVRVEASLEVMGVGWWGGVCLAGGISCEVRIQGKMRGTM
jgi:hypothetical protein